MDLPALLVVIERRAKRISHYVLLRKENPKIRGLRPYSKAQIGREFNILLGMVLAHNMLTSQVLPQDTLMHYDTARRLVKEMV